jgi:hypothetical protein
MANGYKDGALGQAIEREIDAHGLAHVLLLLECICGEKAEHVRANWQDKKTARPWDTMSGRLGKLARDASELLP